jgi:hypothetical protein
MSGKIEPTIVFSFQAPNINYGTITLIPILSTVGYGVFIEVAVRLIGGDGEDRYEYERILEQFYILPDSLPDDEFASTFMSFFENFFHCKVDTETSLPIAALLLRKICPEMLEDYNLNLSKYVLDFSIDKPKIGFHPNRVQTNDS